MPVLETTLAAPRSQEGLKPVGRYLLSLHKYRSGFVHRMCHL